MSLPLQAVERLFERLTATYGRQFLSLYEGLDVAAIKTSWAHELSGFAGRLQALAWALENLPERAPNAIEFRNLARRAPEPETPRLPEPKADPVRIRKELEKLGPIIAEARAKLSDDRLGWAHRIVARADGGCPIAPATLKLAKDALARNGVVS